MRSQVVPMSREELLQLPAVVDISTAARALGIAKSTALASARAGEFPVPILRFGRAFRVSTADLLTLLGITTAGGRDSSKRSTDGSDVDHR